MPVIRALGEVASPCTQVCAIAADGVCRGCGRTLAEIVAWLEAGSADRTAIRDRAALRLAALPGDGGAVRPAN